ncbi:MAG: aldo/keto reductase [Candidatus Sericytochromatia bacterium]|uniref:Aldo/keto reductase n=1 Tax=Candidatus Tanganyikabacteria bacterium TaxID=2961651 RepID=A0A937X673_9BACT|nr:aldo/keto reductase [Candidatus Tanganyikabacteria bacterium]
MPEGIRQVRLGSTEVQISVLGIGTGTFGFGRQSRQSSQSPEALGALLRAAYFAGITWWDTSDDYGTHGHVREGLAGVPRDRVQIASKTHATGGQAARESLELALKELATPYLDLYFLHDTDSPEELEAKLPALRELNRAKDQGLVRAVALSTHHIDTLEACIGLPGLDVVMTNFNKFEDHMDAGLKHYVAALEAHHAAGTGVLVMKAVGEGRLAHVAAESIRWNLEQPYINGVLVGMEDEAQVFENARLAAARPLRT